MKGEHNLLIPGEELDVVIGRLWEGLAVLESIDEAGLLDALPAATEAQASHQRAVSLLAVLRRDLVALAQHLEAVSTTATLLAEVIPRGRAAKR